MTLSAGVYGAFLTADLFNLFVFVEVMLVPSYALLTMSGGRARTAAGRIYLTFSLLASTLLLARRRPGLRGHRHREPGGTGRSGPAEHRRGPG
ncbi:hypothetical protein LUW77_28500 [Streptomyces radiopugnans]|nr:hypothetical protein LUW77_28500 [Streptomyces radiopugnans]